MEGDLLCLPLTCLSPGSPGKTFFLGVSVPVWGRGRQSWRNCTCLSFALLKEEGWHLSSCVLPLWPLRLLSQQPVTATPGSGSPERPHTFLRSGRRSRETAERDWSEGMGKGKTMNSSSSTALILFLWLTASSRTAPRPAGCP